MQRLVVAYLQMLYELPIFHWMFFINHFILRINSHCDIHKFFIQNGTRPSIPTLLNFCWHKQSLCSLPSLRTFSSWDSCALGALWKYKYPQIAHLLLLLKAPFYPHRFYTLAINHIGVDLTVVTS
jgi:hypothetical protein